MKAEVLTPDELTREDIESFWEQGVNMDDWDYIVLAPVESIRLCEDVNQVYDPDDRLMKQQKELYWEQVEFTFERILTGCCSNQWYKATFRGKEYAVGVAYHS